MGHCLISLVNTKYFSDIIPDVLTPVEVAGILKLGRTTTYELLRTGTISSIKIGRKIIVPKKFLENFIEDHANMCYTESQMVGNLSVAGKE